MQPCPGSVVYLYDTFLRKHVYRLCSIYMISTCRLYFYPELHSTPAIVCTVRIRWSSWCNCGRHSKIVHMTGLCTFGGAQKSVAKGCLGGMPPIQNKLTVIKNQKKHAHFGSASGRGEDCVTTKIMPKRSSAKPQGRDHMKQPSQCSMRVLNNKLSIHLLCVPRNLP